MTHLLVMLGIGALESWLCKNEILCPISEFIPSVTAGRGEMSPSLRALAALAGFPVSGTPEFPRSLLPRTEFM